jgi:hypothetical protein
VIGKPGSCYYGCVLNFGAMMLFIFLFEALENMAIAASMLLSALKFRFC